MSLTYLCLCEYRMHLRIEKSCEIILRFARFSLYLQRRKGYDETYLGSVWLFHICESRPLTRVHGIQERSPLGVIYNHVLYTT